MYGAPLQQTLVAYMEVRVGASMGIVSFSFQPAARDILHILRSYNSCVQ